MLSNELRVDMRTDIRIDIGAQRRFRSFDHGFEEGIVIFLEDKRERDLETRYTNIVFEHPALYQIFTCPRIAHMAQGFYDLLWIQIKAEDRQLQVLYLPR